MNSYQLIAPPFPLGSKEITNQQADLLFDWFLNQIPVRLDELERSVRTLQRYSDWKSDLSVNSLDELGDWFHEHVSTVKREKDEMDSIRNRLPRELQSLDFPDYDLDPLTLSLCIDIGIYLGQIMVANVDGLRWQIFKNIPKSIDYRMPIIRKGRIHFNPIHLTTILAYGIARGTKHGKGLRELYEIWVYNFRELDPSFS